MTCCNATAGLSAALLATGRTDRVLLPAFTFPASLGAVRAAGMTPIVADVDAENWTLSGDLLDTALAETGASAIMLVAPFGIKRGWEAELAICRQRGVAVVIDNASGLGGPRPPNAFGEEVFEVFSMHATKPFAVGEGGAILAHRTHDAALRSALHFALSSHVEPRGPVWGFNGKMSEFHAAVGIAQLNRFRDIVSRRQAFAAIYRDRLAPYPEVVCPQDMNSAPWQFFPVLLPTLRLRNVSSRPQLRPASKSVATTARVFRVGPRPDASGHARSPKTWRTACAFCRYALSIPVPKPSRSQTLCSMPSIER